MFQSEKTLLRCSTWYLQWALSVSLAHTVLVIPFLSWFLKSYRMFSFWSYLISVDYWHNNGNQTAFHTSLYEAKITGGVPNVSRFQILMGHTNDHCCLSMSLMNWKLNIEWKGQNQATKLPFFVANTFERFTGNERKHCCGGFWRKEIKYMYKWKNCHEIYLYSTVSKLFIMFCYIFWYIFLNLGCCLSDVFFDLVLFSFISLLGLQ